MRRRLYFCCFLLLRLAWICPNFFARAGSDNSVEGIQNVGNTGIQVFMDDKSVNYAQFLDAEKGSFQAEGPNNTSTWTASMNGQSKLPHRCSIELETAYPFIYAIVAEDKEPATFCHQQRPRTRLQRAVDSPKLHALLGVEWFALSMEYDALNPLQSFTPEESAVAAKACGMPFSYSIHSAPKQRMSGGVFLALLATFVGMLPLTLVLVQSSRDTDGQVSALGLRICVKRSSRIRKAPAYPLVQRLRTTSSPHRVLSSLYCIVPRIVLLLAGFTVLFCQGTDLRNSIIQGREPCFRFVAESKEFQMNCSVLNWNATGYGFMTYISIDANEVFDGSAGSKQDEKFVIDLAGIADFNGLFRIMPSASSLIDAPIIRNVHVRNGEPAPNAGFIIRDTQKYFIVDSCSSSGDISTQGSGGICGRGCGSSSGDIQIRNSYSAGAIMGKEAGGIAGTDAGKSGRVNITQCYSTGAIEGQWAGGICGYSAATFSGQVFIAQSYSRGDIRGLASGGIVGRAAADRGGYIRIEECFSTGSLSSIFAGGITGSYPGSSAGEAHIVNCYTQGVIANNRAGGIAGAYAGGPGGGSLYISNSYASGDLTDNSAGGILGSTHKDFNGIIQVNFSLYNDITETSLVGFDDANYLVDNDNTGNSGNLNDIHGQLYHVDGVQIWDDAIWTLNGNDLMPVLAFQLPQVPSPTPTPTPSMTMTMTTTRTPSSTAKPSSTASPSGSTTSAPLPEDLRDSIINGKEPCFQHLPGKSLFQMNCSILIWQSQGYGPGTYISLSAHEIFDGGGQQQEGTFVIDLSGIDNFQGLIKVNNDVDSFEKSPLIRNVHMKNGATSENGGFIVQKEQQYFIVDSCSSTGNIMKDHGGGIVGENCGRDNGEIKILNSHSTGRIIGLHAGGITGYSTGVNGGIVNIVRCHSSGAIEGDHSGGICGSNAGSAGGQVYIKESYSIGDIVLSAKSSGGIVGTDAASMYGYLRIQECYSIGHIGADSSGGICGQQPASKNGQVHIINCYTRGDVHSDEAGGITGKNTGGYPVNSFGNVYILNTYASGVIIHGNAGGIIGSIHDFFNAEIHLNYSVYNASVLGTGSTDKINTMVGNSADLDDIRGKLYHFGGIQQWSNDVWALNETEEFPILRFQLPPTPSPTPSPTATTTTTATPSVTSTSSRTVSPSGSGTRTPLPGDLRNSIIDGRESCFQYLPGKSLFQMNCSILTWKSQGYGPGTYISLSANEIFDGVGDKRDGNFIIDLSGIDDFQGLISIRSDVDSFEKSPLIRNVHMKNGATAENAGFIVQKEQQYFIVDSCSSTGNIMKDDGGGIVGEKCGRDNGEIKILNSHSTGKIIGQEAGGIIGRMAGVNGGIVNIIRCRSSGAIQGFYSGGICGSLAANDGGSLYIKESYSTGDIAPSAKSSGGIVGSNAGFLNGRVTIQESYSTGEIQARSSGGICGFQSAAFNGEVYIIDCYTRGDIHSDEAGGITGKNTGGYPTSAFGNVYISNTYASGARIHGNAGGIMGSISEELNTEIHLNYSVYDAKVLGSGPTDKINPMVGNSADLDDIRGNLYHFGGIQQWSEDVWALNETEEFPILRFQLPPTPSPSPSATSTSSMTASPSGSANPTPIPGDLRSRIMDGKEPCFYYVFESKMFHMNCSLLFWRSQRYGPGTHISLSANEIFDGGRSERDGNFIIDLSGIENFEGLFKISDAVNSVDNAPLIRNVHVKNGATARRAGFLVRKEQHFFVVDGCSTSGDITNDYAGGIAGYGSGIYDGEIKILNSYSRGTIVGRHSGGIIGSRAGPHGGIAHISHCFSNGRIEGSSAGGIAGATSAAQGGKLYVRASYSTGDIIASARKSGGIVGGNAGFMNGYVHIKECYSTGKISAESSGGIVGFNSATTDGELHVIDCYTRGALDARWAGGITGEDTGGWVSTGPSPSSEFGNVYISNTYASGIVKHEEAGAVIGSINGNFIGEIQLNYSVFNTSKLIGEGLARNSLDLVIGSSFNLDDIRGQLYQYGGVEQWGTDSWAVNGSNQLPILRFQLPPLPSPVPGSTATTTATTTSSPLPSFSGSPTSSNSQVSPSSTVTISAPTPTPIASAVLPETNSMMNLPPQRVARSVTHSSTRRRSKNKRYRRKL